MHFAHRSKGASTLEVVVLFVAAGFFVIAAAPLFSRFLQVRTGTNYLLQATILAQDIMERIRGKSFEELEGQVGEWVLADLEEFLYGFYGDSFPTTIPPGARELSRIVIRKENPHSDMLTVEVEIKWKEILRAYQGTLERTYRVATQVYKEGIQKLRQGG